MENYTNTDFSDSHLVDLFKFLENKKVKRFHLSNDDSGFSFELDHQDNMIYHYSSKTEDCISSLVSIENIDNLKNSVILSILPIKETIDIYNDDKSSFISSLEISIKTDKGICNLIFNSKNNDSDLVDITLLKSTYNIKMPSNYRMITNDFNNQEVIENKYKI
jgi:hypothetical protein